MRPITPCLVVGLLILAGCGSSGEVEPDYLAPSSRWDLNHWKLTLPDEKASEVANTELLAGYASRYFQLDAAGAMVFMAPSGAGSTQNSEYPRSELRELLDPADDNRNWSVRGSHQLTASAQVLRAPSTQKIIVGQIHGFDARPLVKLQWHKGTLKALLKRHPEGSNDEIKHRFAAKVGHAPFSYSIAMRDGVVTVQVEGERITHDVLASDPQWRGVSFYFKAGAYVQDDAEDGADDVGEVRFTHLAVSHGD